MRILAYAAQTLHCRSLLPVFAQLRQLGHEVFMERRGRFCEAEIRDHPTTTGDLDPAAMEFVAKNIGMDALHAQGIQWLERPWYGRWLRWPRPDFDLYLGTTKAFAWLASYGDAGRPQIALPYQNILDTYSFKGRSDLPARIEGHVGFERELRRALPGCSTPTGLPFMDFLVHQQRKWKRKDNTYRALLLHPGGYRNVITAPGEDEVSCLAKQRALYARVLRCLPERSELVVKIHPLAARYHDAEANAPLAEAMGFRVAEGWLGDVLFDCDVVLSLGSSSLFEIAGLGIPYWVLSFVNQERAQYYSEFGSICLKDEEALRRALAERQSPEWSSEVERDFMARLSETCDGGAVERAVQCIIGALR